MKTLLMFCVLYGLFGLAFGPAARADEELMPGDPAPEFELPGSDGKAYKLSVFREKQVVVLAWFPKAFTGG